MPGPHLTLHPVGNAAVLLDERRQALFRLDARSSYAWCCLEEGLGPEEIARAFAEDLRMGRVEAAREAEAVLSHLARLGLPGSAEAPAPAPRQAAPAPSGTAADPGTAAHACRIALLGRVFEIGLPSAAALAAVRSVLGHLETDAVPPDVRVAAVERPGGFAVLVDGVEAETCTAACELAPQVKSAVSVAAVNRHGFAACLHAGAVVAGDGRALLLPGASESGKSCLTLALAHAGHALLTDETVLLEPEGFAVRGVPLACCVKAGAWEAMAALHPALARAPEHLRNDGKRVRYLPAAPAEAAARRWPVGHVVFPAYEKGAATRLDPIGPAEALGRLLESCIAWRVRLTPAFVEALIAWIEGVGRHALRHRSAVEAVAALEALPAASEYGAATVPR